MYCIIIHGFCEINKHLLFSFLTLFSTISPFLSLSLCVHAQEVSPLRVFSFFNLYHLDSLETNLLTQKVPKITPYSILMHSFNFNILFGDTVSYDYTFQSRPQGAS